jgi:hypothetical protein
MFRRGAAQIVWRKRSEAEQLANALGLRCAEQGIGHRAARQPISSLTMATDSRLRRAGREHWA